MAPLINTNLVEAVSALNAEDLSVLEPSLLSGFDSELFITVQEEVVSGLNSNLSAGEIPVDLIKEAQSDLQISTSPSSETLTELKATATNFVPFTEVPSNQPTIIIGTPEEDFLVGSNNRDIIIALAGNDIVFAFDGDDIVAGGDGNDILLGEAGNHFLLGGDGNDILLGEAGNDTLDGGSGDDTLDGGSGDDILDGGSGDDIADYSRLGEAITLLPQGKISIGSLGTHEISNMETIVGATGKANAIDASSGAGQASIDVNLTNNSLIVNNLPGIGSLNFTVQDFVNVTGTPTDDQIVGNSANNSLSGTDGNDFLSGELGNDSLDGGAGDDTLTGGAGADLFVFNFFEGVDSITDFNFFEGDRFVISQAEFGEFSISDSEFIYNESTGTLSFDGDGLGGSNPVELATLPAGQAFSTEALSLI